MLLTALAYAPVLRAGFVWDDGVQVYQNPFILASDGLRAFWLTTKPMDYFPLTSTTLWIEWRLWGANPLGYHVVNVALHALAALLIGGALRGLGVPGAFVAACLFAVHPVGVASAAWISERKNTLSLVLLAFAVVAHLEFERSGRRRWYAASLGGFVSSLLAKSSGVMLAPVLLLLAWYRRGHVSRTDAVRAIPFFAAALVLGLVTLLFQSANAIAGEPVRPEGLLSRLAASAWCIWFYLWKDLAPIGLTAIYPRWDVDPASPLAWLPLLGLALVTGLAWRFRSGRGRPLLLALGYFVGMLLPVLGFAEMAFNRYSLVSDHLQYPAMIAPLALVVAAAAAGMRRVRSRLVGPTAAVAVLALFSALTFQRTRVYESELTFWRDAVQRNPRAWSAQLNLGRALSERGERAAAAERFRAALAVRPTFVSATVNFGNELARLGLLDEAIAEYRRVLERKEDYPDAHYNLAIALERRGQPDAAIEHYRRALAIDPRDVDARNNLGALLVEQGRADEALELLRGAVALEPERLDARLNLAQTLARAGDLEGAIQQLQRAVELDPSQVDALVDLAGLHAMHGERDQAIQLYRRALELQPGHPQARHSLDALLSPAR